MTTSAVRSASLQLSSRTADTRASDLREKVIKYSVDDNSVKTVPYKSVFFGFDKVAVSVIIGVDITNDGSLPVNRITLSISTESPGGNMPNYSVQLTPALDHEAIPQGDVLIIRLKNPLGVKEHVKAEVLFKAISPPIMEKFKLKQA